MIANDYRVQGLGIVAISSNDVEKYPEDSPEMMTEFAFKNKIDSLICLMKRRKLQKLIRQPAHRISFYLIIRTDYFTEGN
jgi:hypothetical protein